MGSPPYESALETLIKEIQWNTIQYNEICLQLSFFELLLPSSVQLFEVIFKTLLY